MVEKNVCGMCLKPKAELKCRSCVNDLCKYCAQFVNEDRLGFMPAEESTLQSGAYCNICYERDIKDQVVQYVSILQKAKDVNVYFTSQGKETRMIRRAKETYKISDCADRDEAVLRLAFMAARSGFNCIVDVDVRSKKIRDGAYQTMKWDGTANAAQIIEKSKKK
jgi:hypothetical protein